MLEMIDRMQSIDYVSVCDEAFNLRTDDAANLNREQLNRGEKADDTNLPYYRDSTIKRKRKKGQQTSPMNLKDTGEFWSSISAYSDNGKQYFQSYDSKYPILDKNYPNILGLNSKSITKFKPYLSETLYILTSNKLQL